MKRVVTAFAAVLLSGGAAFAADIAPASTLRWTGSYIGAQAGYVGGRSRYSEPGYSQPGTMNYDPKGFIGGVYVGYDRQFDNDFVLGGEVDFASGGVEGDSLYYNADGNPAANSAGRAKMRSSGAVRARLGYAADRFLPYVAGGVAFGNYEYGAGVSHAGHYDSFSASDTRVGWTLGAGVEYAFSDNLIGRFEYRYTDFGSKTLDVAETGDWAVGNKVDLKTNDIRVGIAYKF